MNIMRNEDQVALQDLHARVRESVDHYRDAARFVEDGRIARLFDGIADDREAFAARVARTIRENGDLPGAPDADRETGEQLIHHLRAWFASDQTRNVIEQRLEAEVGLADWLSAQRGLGQARQQEALLDALERQIDEIRSRLRDVLE